MLLGAMLVATGAIASRCPGQAVATFQASKTTTVHTNWSPQLVVAGFKWKLRTYTGVGAVCRDYSSSGLFYQSELLPSGFGSPTVRTERADAGRNRRCVAEARAEAEWGAIALDTWTMTAGTSGSALPVRDRCIGLRDRPAFARSSGSARVSLVADLNYPIGSISSFDFAAAWVNDQNIGSGSGQRVKHLVDPVVVSRYEFGGGELIDQWEVIGIESRVFGTGSTRMYNDGPRFVTVVNNARDMDLSIDVGSDASSIVPAPDRGLIEVRVRNGLVTHRTVNGRFVGVAGIPALNTPGTTWQASFDMSGIGFAPPIAPGEPVRIEIGMGGASGGASEDGLVGPVCSLVSLPDAQPDGADLSVAPAGDSVLGYSCLSGSAAVVESISPASDMQPDFVSVPYISQGAAPGTLPSSVQVSIWDQNPMLGGAPIYTVARAPSDVQNIGVFRVLAANTSDRSLPISEVTVDLSDAPALTGGVTYWIEIAMQVPGATEVSVPPSPYSDSSVEDALGYSAATGQFFPLMDPVSGRRPCLPIALYGLENVLVGPLPSAELLEDACFPAGTVLHPYPRSPGNPWVPGEWNAEAAAITGAVSGVTPFEGGAMLRVNAAGGAASQVSQVIDVGAWATQIDSGMVVVDFSAFVNASVATPAPALALLAGTSQTVVGTMNPVGGPIIQGYNRASMGLTTDASPATWEPLRLSMPLPPGTRFLHYEIVGANATIPSSGLFFDCASVVLRSCEALENPGFDPGTPLHPYARSPGDPWIPGEWNAESATIVGPFGCVDPHTPNGMLRIHPVGGAVSQVSQIIDLTAFANAIDAGGVAARFESWFNADQAGTQPRVFLRAGESQTVVGTLVPTGGTPVVGFNERTLSMTQDADCTTWQAISSRLCLPAGTRYLHFELQAPNATTPASGVFFDDASVCLRAVLRRFGVCHFGRGGASLVAGPGGELVVTGIGSTGLDGVELVFPDADAWEGTFADALVAASQPTGLISRTIPLGTVDGVPESPILVASVSDIGDQLEVQVDFTRIGAFTQRVEVYNGATLVVAVDGHSGPAYRVAAIPAGSTPCYLRTGECCGIFSAPIDVHIVGGPTVVGDRVVVRAESPSASIGPMTSIDIIASGVPSLTLTGETVTPFDPTPPCPADFNNDDVVNSQDFFDFLTAFFATMPEADFNNDAVINSQDFFDFLTAFFAGC